MSVIAISGQVGAGEHIVARRVAKELGYKFVDRGVFEEVLKEYGIVDLKDLLDSPLQFLDRLAGEKRDTADLLNRMYLLFAKMNNIVINSRRAFIVLDPFINVLNVFLKAPRTVRVQNLMSWEGIGERSATDYISKEERLRNKIIETFYKKKWDSILPWTLVLNTHKLGFELANKFIIEANAKISKYDDMLGWQDGIPSIDTIETDPILEKAVNKIMPNFGAEVSQEELA
jgi:cytidylate kinase